jgi:RimJ/RimL family protein N-acetyltransferase
MPAISLYRSLGFEVRAPVNVAVLAALSEIPPVAGRPMCGGWLCRSSVRGHEASSLLASRPPCTSPILLGPGSRTVQLEREIRLIPVYEDGSVAEAGLKTPTEAREALAASVSMYRTSGYQPPWIAYLAVAGEECLGTCAFKSPPHNNRVEIAYFTFPANEGRGVATQMARALVEIAHEGQQGILVAAQTLPQESASTAILRKLGFACTGTIQHPEDGPVWEWHMTQAG